jgi:hypothetical protein
MFLGITYGPSVHVKAVGNPHERTSASETWCDLVAMVAVFCGGLG